MTLSTITATKAKQLLAEGATLVDIREANERARERIGGSVHLPISKIGEEVAELPKSGLVIFHCKSGARTAANANRLKDHIGDSCEAYLIEGGLDSWRKAGLPVTIERSQPIEIQRQVQIVAGAVGLLGTILGMFVSSYFYVLPAFIGGGLLFAGITGFCGMARLLMWAPWNRINTN